MSPEELHALKSVEYYSASVTAWYNTQLEHDKSLLTLSAGGIALLITLVTTVGVPSAERLVLYTAALLCFVVCLVAVLAIFKQNGKYVEALVQGEDRPPNPILGRLDSVAIYSFAAGVILAVLIGISAAITSYTEKEKSMANDNKPAGDKAVLRESFGGAGSLKPTPGTNIGIESFHGAVNLSPQTQDMTKSFTGAGNLKPAAPAASGGGSAQGNSTSTPQQDGKK